MKIQVMYHHGMIGDAHGVAIHCAARINELLLEQILGAEPEVDR
jgi:hypothetical protein